MSRRDDRASRSQPQPSYSSAGRTGQFVIDAEGIDREVITADICRYLGNDALVKPGDVEVSRVEIFANAEMSRRTNGFVRTRERNKSSLST